MISCTEFIPAYSELFKYLDKKNGKAEVIKYWKYISSDAQGSLKAYVSKKGIAGCWEYWSHTLTEEAADFRMELDENKETFTIEMRQCPSKGRLLKEKHIEPYEHYCEHCDMMYRRVLEPLGYKYNIDLSNCGQAKCKLTVQKT